MLHRPVDSSGRMKLVARRLALVVAGSLALAAPSAHAGVAASPAQRLAERYAPVLLAEPQLRAYGPGEPYRPTRVDIVLGRRGVVLRDPARRVVKRHRVRLIFVGARATTSIYPAIR